MKIASTNGIHNDMLSWRFVEGKNILTPIAWRDSIPNLKCTPGATTIDLASNHEAMLPIEITTVEKKPKLEETIFKQICFIRRKLKEHKCVMIPISFQ